MSEPASGGLTVPDTAVGVAMERALETRRRDALFQDPFAAELAGRRGAEVARAMGRPGWSVTVRTRVFDDLIRVAVAGHGVATVLNLGAGLDARPYRLELPSELRWVEVDTSETLAHKQRVLRDARPRCALVRHGADLSDSAQRRQALDLSSPGPALMVTEGVLHYLAPAEVKEISSGALDRPAIRYWLLDLAHPLARAWGRRATAAVDLWRFTPEDGLARFEAWGWRTLEVASGWEMARRFGRQTPIMRIAWALSPRSRREAFRGLVTYALLAR